ncbi:hypothetical protein ACJW30_01G272300 [Castanea mollissima]
MASSTTSISGHAQPHHAVLFPFIPPHLARLLLHRRLTVTIFTTLTNRPFISESLKDTTASNLPFSHNMLDIPVAIDTTENLPSMSPFHSFANATKDMQPDFEQALHTLPRVGFMVSDAFLWWTQDSASKFNIPRLVYYAVVHDRLLFGPESDDELITVTRFPWIKVTRNDFEPPFTELEPKGLKYEFTTNVGTAVANSCGIVVNSFYGLEPLFDDYWNRECTPKGWSVGPFCLLSHKWLEMNPTIISPHASGSQADISSAQLKEIENGLEESKVNFLWMIRKSESEISDRFEESIKGRGIVMREWADQREVLMHESVQGFLSHCGWNSVLESICAGVPILAWPMMADQLFNARMVVEEIKVGLMVETCKRERKGSEEECKEVAEKAKKATGEGGSSKCTLDMLIDEICGKNT